MTLVKRPLFWPTLVGLGLGLLALGPALGRGFVLTYDMVFVPAPPLSRADLGFTGGPARAVPSDLVVAVAAKIIPAEYLQKLILLGIFVLACTGAAALLEAGWSQSGTRARLPLLAGLVAGVCYSWNPFVAERLILGQWAMLLGYAGLPWVARELAWRAGPMRPWRLALALVPAAIGGFAAMSITVLVAVPVALLAGSPQPGSPRPGSSRPGSPRPGSSLVDRGRRLGLAVGLIALASLPWIIPSFVVPVLTDPAGATAFAARADTPFGAIGSLLMLSGAWNAQAVPAGYGTGPAAVAWLAIALTSLTGYAILARRYRIAPGIGVAGLLSFMLAALGTWSPTLTTLRDAIASWSGFALLRDGQQFIAPLALVESIGLAAALAALIITTTARAPATPAPATCVPPPHAPATPAPATRVPPPHAPATPAPATRVPPPHAPATPAPATRVPPPHAPATPAPATSGPATAAGATPASATADLAFAAAAPQRPQGQQLTGAAVAIGVIALVAPLVLVPGLAWGAFGRLRAVQYPADWLTARATIDASKQSGSVLLLPWGQYRRYPWNHGEPVYDPWSRLLTRPTIWNDALRVGSITVAAESQSARRLDAAISSRRPLTATLLAAGVRYVIVDDGPLLRQPRARLDALARLPGAQIMLASPDLVVFRLADRHVTISYRSG